MHGSFNEDPETGIFYIEKSQDGTFFMMSKNFLY